MQECIEKKTKKCIYGGVQSGLAWLWIDLCDNVESISFPVVPIKSVSPVFSELVLHFNTTSSRISLDFFFFPIKRSTKAIMVNKVRARTRSLAFPAAALLFEIGPWRPRWDETRPGGDLLTPSPMCVCVWLRPPLKKARRKNFKGCIRL